MSTILLAALLILLVGWLVRAVGRVSRDDRAFRPRVEALEDLIAPSTFTFIGTGNNANWNDAANWTRTAGTVGDKPVNPEDEAEFDGAMSNQNVTLDHADITIRRITASNGFTADIKLAKSLTLASNEGAISNIYKDSNPRFAPQNVNAHLILDDVTLYAENGKFGSTAFKSELRIINGGLLTFNLWSGAELGMNLVIGSAGGGANNGTVRLYNASSPVVNGVHLTVRNDANIFVNKDSLLELRGDGVGGWILDDGDTSGYVRVDGKVLRDGTGEVKVQLPFLVRSGGEVLLKGETLNVNSNGNAATSQASLLVASGGRVTLDRPEGRAVPTLTVADEAIFDGGKLDVLSSWAEVHAAKLVEFKGASELLMTANNPNVFTDLVFQLADPAAKVKLTSGTWSFDFKAGQQGNDRVQVFGSAADGSLFINDTANTTTISGRMHGAAAAGEKYVPIMTVGAHGGGNFNFNTIANVTFKPPGAIIIDPALPASALELEVVKLHLVGAERNARGPAGLRLGAGGCQAAPQQHGS